MAKVNEVIDKRKSNSRSSLFFVLLVVLSSLSSVPALQAAQVTLAWDPEPAVQGYRVYFGTASNVYEAVVDAGSRTDCKITGLAAGVTYYFVCTAYDASSESSFSNEIVYTTPAQAGSDPPDPTSSNATAASGGGGCFIATAAYGSWLSPEVVELREFRDRYLLTNQAGKAFVELYYRISPPIAAFIAGHETLKTAVRCGLAPVVYAVKYPAAAGLFLLVAVIAGIGAGRAIRRPVSEN